MIRVTQYYGRFNDMRGHIVGLPQWARVLVAIAALPGLVLLVLSTVAFAVSLLALLLLTVPVYVLLRWAVGVVSRPPSAGPPASGVKRVEATIVE
jgi:hypothetical protein